MMTQVTIQTQATILTSMIDDVFCEMWKGAYIYSLGREIGQGRS